jgi:hypothetical protein
MSNAIPYVVVEHTGPGKQVVTEHAGKKAAHTYAKELRASGKSAYAHKRADAIKFGLITHTGA